MARGNEAAISFRALSTLTLQDAIAQTRAGSPAGLADLYNRYSGPMLALARHLTGSVSDAEDVVHDVFVGLPEALRHYDERGTFEAWLRRIVTNSALATMRRSRTHERRFAPGVEPAHVPAPDQLHGGEVWRAVAALPGSLRVTVELRHLGGLTHEETARVLGITSGAVRVRYTRALRLLRNALENDR